MSIPRYIEIFGDAACKGIGPTEEDEGKNADVGRKPSTCIFRRPQLRRQHATKHLEKILKQTCSTAAKSEAAAAEAEAPAIEAPTTTPVQHNYQKHQQRLLPPQRQEEEEEGEEEEQEYEEQNQQESEVRLIAALRRCREIEEEDEGSMEGSMEESLGSIPKFIDINNLSLSVSLLRSFTGSSSRSSGMDWMESSGPLMKSMNMSGRERFASVGHCTMNQDCFLLKPQRRHSRHSMISLPAVASNSNNNDGNSSDNCRQNSLSSIALQKPQRQDSLHDSCSGSVLKRRLSCLPFLAAECCPHQSQQGLFKPQRKPSLNSVRSSRSSFSMKRLQMSLKIGSFAEEERSLQGKQFSSSSFRLLPARVEHIRRTCSGPASFLLSVSPKQPVHGTDDRFAVAAASPVPLGLFKPQRKPSNSSCRTSQGSSFTMKRLQMRCMEIESFPELPLAKPKSSISSSSSFRLTSRGVKEINRTGSGPTSFVINGDTQHGLFRPQRQLSASNMPTSNSSPKQPIGTIGSFLAEKLQPAVLSSVFLPSPQLEQRMKSFNKPTSFNIGKDSGKQGLLQPQRKPSAASSVATKENTYKIPPAASSGPTKDNACNFLTSKDESSTTSHLNTKTRMRRWSMLSMPAATPPFLLKNDENKHGLFKPQRRPSESETQLLAMVKDMSSIIKGSSSASSNRRRRTIRPVPAPAGILRSCSVDGCNVGLLKPQRKPSQILPESAVGV